MITEVPLPPFNHILSQINVIHIVASYFFKNHFNIITPTTPRPSSGLFPLSLPTKIIYVCFILHAYYTSRPSHPFYFFTLLLYGEDKL
jgi:hypothetical protein